jgi:hypothetical protein
MRSHSLICGTLASVLILILCFTTFSSTHAQEIAYHSGPIYSITFESANQTNSTSAVNWQPGRSPNSGVVYFTGASDSYLDLLTLRDDNGRSFPMVGGSMSVEFWVAYSRFNSWSHFFDIGNGADRDILVCGNTGNSRTVRYSSVITPNATGNFRSVVIDVESTFYASVYQHVVITSNLISLSDTWSNSAMRYTIFVDGRYLGNFTNYVLPFVQRNNSWMGRSNWAADQRFQGWIDSMHYYDYGMDIQAVWAHSVLQRPPMFELVLSEDPRQIAGASATYNYLSVDSDDVALNISRYHTGKFTLHTTFMTFYCVVCLFCWLVFVLNNMNYYLLY